MLASTLKEILNNAVKYSTVGSPITVAANDGQKELLLSVHNHGPTIRTEDREHIFEKFYRGAEHRHAAPGTGLGLFVARRVIEVHGGRIWVTSGESEGTTFHLSLPRQAPPEAFKETLT
jgi:signal transduction histidine kinase